MKTITEKQLEKKVKLSLIIFTALLIISGVTAFPLEWELSLLAKSSLICSNTILHDWIEKTYEAVRNSNNTYPFLSYGTDWLAFAHIVIATAFIGPLKNPVKNIWVIQFGMIASLMVFPLAFICGPIRHIPFYWQLIDCSFGLFGLIPLYIAYRNTKQLETLTFKNK
ncbi:MAG TPA: hypothetical protein VKG26_10385 [Bacteroidia bacterium]|nr:hypothetical protein [Bacteroidia bacterium]